MAIIYTYPTKAIPNANDLILISDSEDSNKTKQVKVSTLPGGSGSGVSSVTSANTAITVANPTSTPVLTSTVYGGTSVIGHVPTGGSASTYLKGDASWATPPDTTIDTKNAAVSVANPTISLDFGTALTAISGGGGAAAISFTGSLTNLSDVLYESGANGSLYVGSTPPGLVSTPDANVAVGYNAGYGLTEGFDNTFVGTNAGKAVTTADYNVAIGKDAMNGENGGVHSENVAVGDSAGKQIGGIRNVLIGKSSGEGAVGTTSYTTNVAIGYEAGKGLRTASNSVIIGSSAGTLHTSGGNSVFIGASAGDAVTTGAGNIMIGQGSDSSSATTSYAIAIGVGATAEDGGLSMGRSSTAVQDSIAIGRGTTATGIDSVVIGEGATSGTSSTVLGQGAQSASGGTALGQGANAASNGIALGKGAASTASAIAIGSSGTPITLSSGQTGGTVTLPVLINGTLQYYIKLHPA